MAWGRDAEAETGPEAGNLAACGGESGRDPARVEGDPGGYWRGRGGRISEFQFFGKLTFGTRSQNGWNRHNIAEVQFNTVLVRS